MVCLYHFIVGAIKIVFNNKKVVDEVKSIKTTLKSAFSAVKDEFSDHLDAINRNTNEIQTNYEFLCELESKMNKLCERIDYLETKIFDNKVCSRISLTPREQEVFLMLYSSEEGITIEDIAKTLAFKDFQVNEIIDNLVLKGIPILRQIFNGCIKLYLELKFKEKHTKENIVDINSSIARTVLNQI